MNNILLLLFPLLLCLQAAAQPAYSRADSIAASFDEPYEDAADLAGKLTRSFQTDEEKARVIFMWIAHNIRYDCSKYKNPSKPDIKAHSKEDFFEKMQQWEEKEMAKSLKGKRGVCSDYSRLFKTMCDAVGLEAEIITGHARDFYKPYRNVHDNPHAWNAVKLGGEWRLLDATWGAGYVDAEVTKFTRRVSPGHFKTPPAWFAQTHLPADEKWQLLDPPVDKKNFPDQPIVNYGQTDYPFVDFSTAPQTVAGGGQYEIRLKFSKTPKAFMVATSKSKMIDFDKQEENGWVVLRFYSRSRDIIIFGGESQRSKMDWLARYEVK